MDQMSPEIKKQFRMYVAKVQFNARGSVFDFNPRGIRLRHGDRVMVSTRRGREIARVLSLLSISEKRRLRPIIQRVDDKELLSHQAIVDKEMLGVEYCRERIRLDKLNMSLVRASFLPDGSKAIFYYTALERVDFRQLVKDLARKFHTRIQMHQVGARDKAKLTGGIGVCGRELCCSNFINKFMPVNVKMARDQNISLNPTRITGQCGRLKCCLSYEHKTYREERKGLPGTGAIVLYQGAELKIISVDILAKALLLQLADGNYKRVPISDVQKISEGNESELGPLSPEEKKALATLDDTALDESKLEGPEVGIENDVEK